jgi:hypothetical protein
VTEIDKAEIATRHGLPAEFGERLQGVTVEELDADAAAAAASLQQPEEPSEAEQFVDYILGGSRLKDERDRAIYDALTRDGSEPAPAPESEGPPDFDGGVRETPSLPANPEAEHDALIAGLLAAKRLDAPSGEQW